MPAYIDRDVLMEAVQKSRKNNKHKTTAAYVAHDAEHCRFLRLIEKTPAADVEPVIHAHWIVDDEYLVCSHCGESYRAAETRWEVEFQLKHGDANKRCHGCGAHMDEVVEK